jgi:hypothetical protein
VRSSIIRRLPRFSTAEGSWNLRSPRKSRHSRKGGNPDRDVDPRLRAGDEAYDFHFYGRATGPSPLSKTVSRRLLF